MAQRKSQTTHDQMVRLVYDHLVSQGYGEVKADLNGFTQPDLLYWSETNRGHIPDLTAKGNGTSNIFEVETNDSIFDQHTEDQWKLFSANADEHGKVFRVVVPKGSEQSANLRLDRLGIRAQVWTIG